MGTLIIDGNSLCHAAHNATKLTVGMGGMQTQAIFGMIKSIKLLAGKFPEWQMLVLWDGKAEWRKALLPDYKGNRVAKDEVQAAHKEAYKVQSPYVRKALSLLGVRQMFAQYHEADDMAGLLSKKLSAVGTTLMLVSGDKDWLQLVNANTTWFDPIRDNTVGMGNFSNFTGYFTTWEFVQGKALMGDSSDNIPGVGGIGAKGAPEFLAQFKSVEDYFLLVDNGVFKPKKVAHQKLASKEGREIFSRNIKLMNLLDVPVPKSEDIVNIKPDYHEGRFRILCEKLAFMSILRDFDAFVRPFRELQSLPKAA